MDAPIWRLIQADAPFVAVALHDGHAVRDEVAGLHAVTEHDRLREEDPFTAHWTSIAPNRIVVRRSRFEVDMNRPRRKAVYLQAEDAWGLRVWKEPPPDHIVERSLAQYDAFYHAVGGLFEELHTRFGRLLVVDLHSYNHRRQGPEAPPASKLGNPQVNLGTQWMDRRRWGDLLERFMFNLKSFDFPTGHLDVRENIRFKGGYFPSWVHQHFHNACVLELEFKKFFMDEWTGQPDPTLIQGIEDALHACVPNLLEDLKKTQSEEHWFKASDI